jgi:phage FluMu protein Com
MKKTGAGRLSRRRSPLRIADPISLRLDARMAPIYHPKPLSGGDRKALAKELGKARAMANILASRSADMRAKGEAMIQQADKLACESWNERMWSDGEPIDPSPTIDQAVNGGFPWLEIRCTRCKTPSDVDLAAMKHPPSTFVHDLASRLRCRKCAKAGRRPPATLLQLAAPSSNRSLNDVQSLLCRLLDYADHWLKTGSGCGDRCVGVGIIRLIPQACSLPLAN